MTKSELLTWLQEAYQQWEAFLDQIGPERMDQPGVNGQWSMKDIVVGEFFDHFHDDHEPDVRAWLARMEKQ